ncbi:hypothetical protein GCM10009837_03450 [Streptomyces durmitorensis]
MDVGVDAVVVRVVVEDRADVEPAHDPVRVRLVEGGVEPLPGLGGLVRRGDPERGVALLQAELLVPGGDFVRFELPEEDSERGVHAAARGRGGGTPVRRVRVEVRDPLGLCEEPLRLRDGVVPADQHAQCVRLLRALVGRQHIAVRTGDLEGGDLVIAVVEKLVVLLGRGGQLVERFVDGRVVLTRPAFDRGKVTVERGLDRLGGGAYLGSGGLRSIRHSADAIRTGPVLAQ